MFYSKTTGGFYDRAIHGDNIPADAVEITKEQYSTLLDGQSSGKRIVADGDGFPVLQYPPAPTLNQIIAHYTSGVQKYLDDFAKTHSYDSILSACTYATSTVQKFAAEGQYAVEARDATWAKCYEILADVESGKRPMPSLEEIIAELPELEWPQ